MAIDDNAIYGLTGAQIKELPGKIEAVKGLAKVLTTEDYNYPANNPTKVALWLLKPGNYIWAESVQVVGDNSGWTLNAYGFHGALVGGKADNGRVWQLWWGSSNNQITQVQVDQSGYRTSIAHLLQRENIINNLTSTNTEQPLAANQGKVLKDLVDSLAIRGAGAPTTSTVGQVGTLYEDTTNGDLYICTDATDPYVWEAVGAGGGGGGVIELTSADYNYDPLNTGTNTAIALWMLNPGMYKIAEDGVRIYYNTNANELFDTGHTFVSMWEEETRDRILVVPTVSTNGLITFYVTKANGTSTTSYNFLKSSERVQTTGSSTTDVMSQKAVTDAITANGAGTRKATSTGWNTTAPLDYADVSLSGVAEGFVRGAVFNTGKGIDDMYKFVGVGAYAAESPYLHPYFVQVTVSDDGTGQTSAPAAERMALYKEIPATFTTNEWDALWA